MRGMHLDVKRDVFFLNLVVLAFGGNGGGGPQITFTVSPKSIEEDTEVGTSLTSLSASGGVAPYKFSLDQGVTQFSIKDNVVSVAAALDYEIKTSYDLVITVVDSTLEVELTASATFTVTIIANKAPAFSKTNYEFKGLPANIRIGTSIGTVTATDTNTGVNKLKSISIVAGNTDSTLGIKVTEGEGEINLAKAPTLESYTLTLNAIDGGTPPSLSVFLAELQLTVLVYYFLWDLS